MTNLLACLNIAAAAGILLAGGFSLSETGSIAIIGGTEGSTTILTTLKLIWLIRSEFIFSALVIILLIANTIVLFRMKSRPDSIPEP